ncbi:hypothetical protein D3C79_697210 [compost metagenome]
MRALQTTDVSNADFTHYGQAASTHYLVEEVRKGRLQLSDFLTGVAVLVLTWNTFEQRSITQPRDWRHTGVENIGGIELNRRVRPVAEFTAPRGTGRQGSGEAQTVQTDIFRVLNEVLRVTGNNQRRQWL